IDVSQAVAWTRGQFSFVGVSLSDVVKEVERQYDIKVSTDSKLDYLYTGNFSKDKSPKDVLEIIGKPFGISFEIEKE
ncbi:MAG: FecR domain-containing protein, partial [Bacteroidales bacterium]